MLLVCVVSVLVSLVFIYTCHVSVSLLFVPAYTSTKGSIVRRDSVNNRKIKKVDHKKKKSASRTAGSHSIAMRTGMNLNYRETTGLTSQRLLAAPGS